MKKLFSLMAITLLVFGNQSHANNTKQTQINNTLRQIVSLAEKGEQMNLKVVSDTLGEPNLFGDAIFSQVPDSPALMTYYPIERKDSPLKSVSFRMELEMLEGYGVVNGSVEFEFKSEYCPKIADYERVTGTKAMSSQVPNSPDLYTGRSSSYTMHHLVTKSDKSLFVVGCRVSMISEAKLS